jgi:hypothetical protein
LSFSSPLQEHVILGHLTLPEQQAVDAFQKKFLKDKRSQSQLQLCMDEATQSRATAQESAITENVVASALPAAPGVDFEISSAPDDPAASTVQAKKKLGHTKGGKTQSAKATAIAKRPAMAKRPAAATASVVAAGREKTVSSVAGDVAGWLKQPQQRCYECCSSTFAGRSNCTKDFDQKREMWTKLMERLPEQLGNISQLSRAYWSYTTQSHLNLVDATFAWASKLGLWPNYVNITETGVVVAGAEVPGLQIADNSAMAVDKDMDQITAACTSNVQTGQQVQMLEVAAGDSEPAASHAIAETGLVATVAVEEAVAQVNAANSTGEIETEQVPTPAGAKTTQKQVTAIGAATGMAKSKTGKLGTKQAAAKAKAKCKAKAAAKGKVKGEASGASKAAAPGSGQLKQKLQSVAKRSCTIISYESHPEATGCKNNHK